MQILHDKSDLNDFGHECIIMRQDNNTCKAIEFQYKKHVYTCMQILHGKSDLISMANKYKQNYRHECIIYTILQLLQSQSVMKYDTAYKQLTGDSH